MSKYFVTFSIPAAAIKDWTSNVDEATRKQQSDDLMQAWQKWMTDHESVIVDKGLPLGKTKQVDSNGISDAVNDLNWYLVVEAESQDVAAELFKDHPHLQIPTAYIQVMGTAGMSS